MRFLCLPCDAPMTLERTEGPHAGAVSAVFTCPKCGRAVGMLMNPMETQLVQSMNVRIAPAGGESGGAVPSAAAPAATALTAPPGSFTPAALGASAVGVAASSANAGGGTSGGGKCPFAAMMPPPEAEAGASAPALAAPPQPAASAVGPITWSPEADERLKRIPIFVRPMAAKAIEDFARKRGSAVVTAEIMEAVKQAYGM